MGKRTKETKKLSGDNSSTERVPKDWRVIRVFPESIMAEQYAERLNWISIDPPSKTIKLKTGYAVICKKFKIMLPPYQPLALDRQFWESIIEESDDGDIFCADEEGRAFFRIDKESKTVIPMKVPMPEYSFNFDHFVKEFASFGWAVQKRTELKGYWINEEYIRKNAKVDLDTYLNKSKVDIKAGIEDNFSGVKELSVDEDGNDIDWWITQDRLQDIWHQYSLEMIHLIGGRLFSYDRTCVEHCDHILEYAKSILYDMIIRIQKDYKNNIEK